MLQAAATIIDHGFAKLKDVYTHCFPDCKYDQALARRRLLQMPLVCIRIDYKPGLAECMLIEHVRGVEYKNMRTLLHSVVANSASPSTVVNKSVVKSLLGLCQSDRERECVRYAFFKSFGMSATQARKIFGFENVTRRSKNVEQAIEHAKYIRTSIEKL